MVKSPRSTNWLKNTEVIGNQSYRQNTSLMREKIKRMILIIHLKNEMC